MPSSAAMFGTDSAMSSLGRQNSSLRITATQRDCVATGMTAIRWLTFNAPAELTPKFPEGRWAKGCVDEVGADGFDDGVLVVDYVDAEDSSAEVINGVIASICTKRVRAARPLIRRRISWAVTAWLEAKTV